MTLLETKFFARVVPMMDDRGCWEWSGALHPQGYTQFWVPGESIPRKGHRASYEIHNGPIPKGLDIDHLCRNRGCVNPKHLEAVTHRENMLRGETVSGIAARKSTCRNGHPFDWIIPTNGKRGCRMCHNERQRLYNIRRAERRLCES